MRRIKTGRGRRRRIRIRRRRRMRRVHQRWDNLMKVQRWFNKDEHAEHTKKTYMIKTEEGGDD
jgi:heme-degrading monooxygenase HmoA